MVSRAVPFCSHLGARQFRLSGGQRRRTAALSRCLPDLGHDRRTSDPHRGSQRQKRRPTRASSVELSSFKYRATARRSSRLRRRARWRSSTRRRTRRWTRRSPLQACARRSTPRQEWRQIFNEVWRLQRDFFYDSNMHGVDWKAIRDQYAAMIEDCTSREDVSFVIREYDCRDERRPRLLLRRR